MIEFLLTYLLHSTVLLAGALLLVRLPGLRRASAREALLRTALVAGLLTAWGQYAPLQLTLGIPGAPASLAEAVHGRSATALAPDSARPALEERSAPEPTVPAGEAGEQQATRQGWSLALVLPGLLLATCLLFALLRFAHAWSVLRHVLARAEPVRDPELLRRVEESVDLSHARIRVNVLVTPRITTPFAVGRRTIVLPADLMTRMPVASVRGVLVHELAHLERWDPLWNALLSFLASALAFQPLNLLVLRACRGASEEICDARAAERTGEPIVLARSLVELARAPSPFPSLVAIGMASRTHLTSRVEALLENKETHMPRSRLALLALLPLALGSFLPALSFAETNASVDGIPVKQVVIDPGHGGELEGVQGYADEEDVVLAIAHEVRNVLVARGIDVVMTREEDVALAETPARDMAARVGTVTPETDAFVSIHADGGASTLEGIHTWYPDRVDVESSASDLVFRSRHLAEAVQAHLVDETQATDNGVDANGFYVLRNAGVPAAMVDVGYLTHPQEGKRLARRAYQRRVAEAIAAGIISFLASEEAAPESAALALLEEIVGRCSATPGSLSRGAGAPMPSGPDSNHFIQVPEGFLERAEEQCVRRLLANPEILEWWDDVARERSQYR